MTIKERLKKYCEHRHTTIGTFCRMTEISGSYFNQVKERVSVDIQRRIKESKMYPDLNLEWLNTGKGEMLLPTVQAAVMPPYPVENVEEVAQPSAVATIEQPPIVPDKVVRDPNITVLEWVDSRESDHSQSAFNIASIVKRTKCVVQMNNNAMASALYQNEYVFLKPFAEDSEIIDGEIYGIETRARGILIRFVYDDGDYYLTRPKNTREYGDIRIAKREVVERYHIVFHGSTHLSSIPDNEAEMTKQLETQSEYITSLICQLDKAGNRHDRLIDILEKKC